MTTNKSYKNFTIIAVFLSVFVMLAIGLIIWLFYGNSEQELSFGGPAIVIIAIVLSVLTFTLSSAVFAALDKSKKDSALGMPEGSIRALIALSLIALFFIMATQIYWRTSASTTSKIEKVSEEDMKDISIKDIVSKVKDSSEISRDTIKATPPDTSRKIVVKYKYSYTVLIKTPANSDASDMAKNIIASFTALIAAISGFYFGSGSSKGKDGGSDTKPDASTKITPKIPVEKTGTVGKEMKFEWEVNPPGQEIAAEAIGDSHTPVKQVEGSPLQFSYTPSVKGSVTIKVYLKKNPSVFQEYPITINEKSAEQAV